MILKSLNILLLFVWAVFLSWLLSYGKSDLIRLLHPRLWWVLYVAVVVLILYLFSLITSFSKIEERKELVFELPGIIILFVPLMYFSLAKDARLDGASIQNRIIKNDNGVYLNTVPSFGLFNDSGSSDLTFSKIIQQPKKFEHKEVEILCQSFVNDKLPENTAMCYRYIITCCAADALPAFIFLKHQNDLEIENNRWVKVSGPLSIIRNHGMEFPSVEIDEIKYVEEPDFPWAM